MKHLKRTIIFLSVLLIIVFICILIVNKKTQGDEMGNREVDRSQDFIKDMSLVEDYGTFFSVEKMLNNFINNVASDNKEATYSLLDNAYIEQNNITKDNVLNKISDITKYDDNVRIRKMYRQKNEKNAIYYINCILEKEHTGKEFFFVLYEDMENLTYSIANINKETYEKEIKNTNKKLEEKCIEKNEYNKTETKIPTEKERVSKYLKDLIENALYYPEYTYGLLNEDYKNKRFPTLKDFEEYVDNKRQMFLSYNKTNKKKASEFDNIDEYLIYLSQVNYLELEGYQIRNEEGYNRYICTDNYGNYYIFYATSPFNYSVVLDTYTINLPEFTSKYEFATTEEKVMLNIQKIVEALNEKDYNYVYSKLANEFKVNYFKTYEDFEKYAKETFDIENEVTYNKYTESESLSTYKITLKGKNKTITKTIVMRLEEGTDFVMSFNVE